MEAVAKFPFQGKADDELSFPKNSILKIYNNTEIRGWYKAELNGRFGYIPSNYIELTPMSFATKLGDDEAEAFLLGLGHNDGSFLVRPSSFPGDFTLLVKDDNKVEHFGIFNNGKGQLWIWKDKQFDSINDLIKHYRSVPVCKALYLKDLASPLPIGAGYLDSQVVAKYDYKPKDSSELEMQKGDIITIRSKNDDSWWYGEIERDDQKYQGFFPRGIVETLQE